MACTGSRTSDIPPLPPPKKGEKGQESALGLLGACKSSCSTITPKFPRRYNWILIPALRFKSDLQKVPLHLPPPSPHLRQPVSIDITWEGVLQTDLRSVRHRFEGLAEPRQSGQALWLDEGNTRVLAPQCPSALPLPPPRAGSQRSPQALRGAWQERNSTAAERGEPLAQDLQKQKVCNLAAAFHTPCPSCPL